MAGSGHARQPPSPRPRVSISHAREASSTAGGTWPGMAAHDPERTAKTRIRRRRMRIAQAAQQLGISATTLKRLEQRGLIRVRKDRNGQRRYTIDDIQAIQALYYPAAPAATAAAPDAAARPA